MDKREKQTRRVWCNRCNNKTKHYIISEYEKHGSDTYDGVPISWSYRWQILECCGCEDVIIEKVQNFSEWYEPEINYFPPIAKRHMPSWSTEIYDDPIILLSEVYIAYSDGLDRLAAMGVRTILDMILTKKVGNHGSFNGRLKKLQEEGFIGEKNRKFLSSVLEAGHAAAHRGHVPKSTEVEQMLDIVENLLQAVYVLDGASEELKRSTPGRPT